MNFKTALLPLSLAALAGIWILVPSFRWSEASTRGLAWGLASGWTYALLVLANRPLVRARGSSWTLAMGQNAVAALVLATRRFWEMVQVIAAFTLAHTLTLALCVFGVCRLPAWVVEPVIALSIVFVALENLLRPQRAHSRLRLTVAFGFGLVHGLGFAGGLLTAMAGLPAAGTWLALGAFSLGVEAGHQWVVLPLFGLLVVSRLQLHHSLHAVLLRYGTSVISAGGVYYLCVAVQEQFFSR